MSARSSFCSQSSRLYIHEVLWHCPKLVILVWIPFTCLIISDGWLKFQRGLLISLLLLITEEGQEDDDEEQKEDQEIIEDAENNSEKESDEESDKYSDILEESGSEDDDTGEEVYKKRENVSRSKNEKTEDKEMMEAARKEIPYTFEGMAKVLIFIVKYEGSSIFLFEIRVSVVWAANYNVASL